MKGQASFNFSRKWFLVYLIGLLGREILENELTRVFLKFKKILFFLLKINIFLCFGLFWCANFKNNFKKIKKIILMYFNIKNTLKNNHNHTPKHILTIASGFSESNIIIISRNC